MIVNKKPRFFTGISATGTLTLGHYLGLIRHIITLQEEYEVIIMIADLHALTVQKKNMNYQKKSYEIAALLYACGLEENCKIFIQSQIKEHLELTWILSPLMTVRELNNMIQYKEKKGKNETGNLALFSYPVLMAADILLYDADLVIVGQDQQQHCELTTKVFHKFSNFYQTDILKLPKFTIPKLGSKIMSLQNPEKKMSKSENDYIALLDEETIIKNKIKKARTDSENKIYYDPEKKPGISNLLIIYAIFSNKEISEAERKLTNYNYDQFKIFLAELIAKRLEIIKKNFVIYQAKINKLLEKNLIYLQIIAQNKIKEIRKKIKLIH